VSDIAATIEISGRAAALHREAVVCDMTLPWGNWEENKNSILDRFEAVGVDFVSLTVGLDRMSLEETVRRVAAERARIRSWGERFVFVESVSDIRRAKASGKLALGFHFQGSNPLGGDSNMVELYYRLGVRHMLLAYNQRNHAADGCSERSDAGLSRYGLKLIEEMNRVGMILDCTHTGYRSSMEAMEACRGPVLFSHSNAHALCPHDRNIKDDQIRACAATGGVIGITGVGHFLAEDMQATTEAFVRHIDYVSSLVGPQHIGLGIDHVYYLGHKAQQRAASPDMYPHGYPAGGGSYLRPEHIPEITELLMRRGYSDADIKAILGGNFMRVAGQVWK
jgi:membrane dipeptidase